MRPAPLRISRRRTSSACRAGLAGFVFTVGNRQLPHCVKCVFTQLDRSTVGGFLAINDVTTSGKDQEDNHSIVK